LLTPVSLLRDLFVTGPGPEAGGMSQGSEPWRHTPEKSGTDAGAAVWVGATAGAPVCPKAAVVAEVTNKKNKSKSRCIAMATSLSGSPIASRARVHSISIALTARGMVCGVICPIQKPLSGQDLEAKLVGKVHVSRVLFRRAAAMLIRAWALVRNVNDENEKRTTGRIEL
jgi:hypothetical protein